MDGASGDSSWNNLNAAPHFKQNYDLPRPQPIAGIITQHTQTYPRYDNSQHLPPPSSAISVPGSPKPPGDLLYKTKVCTNYKKGFCTYKERCRFAHGMEDLRQPPPLAGWENNEAEGAIGSMAKGSLTGQREKIARPCRYFAEGNCPYGERCIFLHGNGGGPSNTPSIDQSSAGNVSASGSFLQVPPVSKLNYKTRLCSWWEKGEVCKYRDRCYFAHGPAELQKHDGGTNAAHGAPAANVQHPPTNLDMGAPPLCSYGVQGYTQGTNQASNHAHQTAPWMAAYSVKGGHMMNNEGGSMPAPYHQGQQNQPQYSSYSSDQNGQDSQQQINLPNGQSRNWTYKDPPPNNPPEPTDYTVRYSKAEAWGG